MRLREKSGGAMVFVILMLCLLAVLSTGFLTMIQAACRSGAENGRYARSLVMARSVHQSVCRRLEEAEWLADEEETKEIYGEGETEDVKAEIRILVLPEEDQAEVSTEVSCGGFHFSFFTRIPVEEREG
ncbi:MAG TPA: hypothetical protein H9716_13720 [Candidatus Enterocloster faecavium]|uniref:Uncharacterized protein n=1 Tax=Candidatus Enterocloster faecavium TaxID=2838560 RepID=A0A9D2LAK2_9FIRM|nr:hypothetical protein [Candidatus Enterocloster faecavium]